MDQKMDNKEKKESPEENQPDLAKQGSLRKKRLLFGLFALITIIVAAVWFFWWFFSGRFAESTSDAYVQGNMVEITPQISGNVAKIYVQETDYVCQGQSLVDLDSTDYQLAYDGAKAYLAEVVRRVAGEYEMTRALFSQYKQSRANYIKAQEDFQHRKNLIDSRGVSLEAYQHALASLRVSKQQVKKMGYEFKKALAFVEGTSVNSHPLVEIAREKFKEAYVNLQRCQVKSPVNGIVTQRKTQVGESVGPTQALLAIVPIDQIWIDANYKETNLKNIRIGQQVIVYADMYGSGVKYQGTVAGINPGTGSVFSVLPPQNATGNWIKIVQRIPVRIELNPKEIEKHPLWLGLTMKTRINTRQRQGKMVKESEKITQPIYQTDLFSRQIEGARELAARIITKNIPENLNPDQKFLLLPQETD
jgi:membrane fusion protein (multidrug efflux system)